MRDGRGFPKILLYIGYGVFAAFVLVVSFGKMDTGRVVKSSLEPPMWKRLFAPVSWRNLPFEISAEEEALVRTCRHLWYLHRSSHDGWREKDAKHFWELEEELKEKPEFFYGHFLLGTWHRGRGEENLAEKHFGLALEHAPVVLRQRYEDSDGQPLVDGYVDTYSIECNRVKNNSVDPSLELLYRGLMTDAEGFIYVPVYDTVYRLYAVSQPEGAIVKYPRLGFFEARAREAEMPVAKVWRPGEDPSGNPEYEDAERTRDLSIEFPPNTFNIESVARNRRDGSTVFGNGRENSRGAAFAVSPPAISAATWLDVVEIRLGLDPSRFDVRRLKVFDHQTRLPLFDGDKARGDIRMTTGSTIQIWSMEEPLPGKIDVWMEVFNHDSDAQRLRIEPKTGATAHSEWAACGVLDIQPGLLSYRGGFLSPGEHVNWKTSLAFDWAGNSTGVGICAVARDGRKDFATGLPPGTSPVYFDIPLGDIAYLECTSYGKRKRPFFLPFFFDGVALPSSGNEPLGPPPVVTIPVRGEEFSWSARDVLPVRMGIEIRRGSWKKMPPLGATVIVASGSPEAEKLDSTFTLFAWENDNVFGGILKRNLSLFDTTGAPLEQGPVVTEESLQSASGSDRYNEERRVYPVPLTELGHIELSLGLREQGRRPD